MDKLAHQATKGVAAKRLLEDPLVGEFFERTEEQFIRQWKASAPEATDVREDLHSKVCALASLHDWLAQVVQIGKRAEEKMAYIDELASSDSNA